MQLIILILTIAAIGAAAGWFLSLWLVVAISAVCVCALLFLWKETRGYNGSAGIALGFSLLVIKLFLAAMWLAHILSSADLSGSFASMDWPSIKKFLFK